MAGNANVASDKFRLAVNRGAGSKMSVEAQSSGGSNAPLDQRNESCSSEEDNEKGDAGGLLGELLDNGLLCGSKWDKDGRAFRQVGNAAIERLGTMRTKRNKHNDRNDRWEAHEKRAPLRELRRSQS